jgi:hypothetical protein
MNKLAQRPNGDPIVMLAPDVCDDVIANTLQRREDLTLADLDLDRPKIASLWDVASPIDAPLYPDHGRDLHPVRLIAAEDIREVRHDKVDYDGPLFYLSTVGDMAMLSAVPDHARPLDLTGSRTLLSIARHWGVCDATEGVASVTRDAPCGMVFVSLEMARHVVGFRDFNLTFAQDPALALYQAGFRLSTPFEGQMLVTPKYLYRAETSGKLPAFARILVLYLLALWRSPARPAVTRKVILLLSIDDRGTERQVRRVRRLCKEKGMDVVEVYVLSRYDWEAPPPPAEIVERLERALGDADPATALFAVHQGVAFSRAETEIVAALATWSARYPSLKMGLDARRSTGPGESFGVWFDQPEELDPVFGALRGE